MTKSELQTMFSTLADTVGTWVSAGKARERELLQTDRSGEEEDELDQWQQRNAFYDTVEHVFITIYEELLNDPTISNQFAQFFSHIEFDEPGEDWLP